MASQNQTSAILITAGVILLLALYIYISKISTHTRTYFEAAAKRRSCNLTLKTFVAILLLDRGVQALSIYRISHRINNRLIGRLLTNIGFYITGIEIYYNSKIGKGVEIWHGQGTVIGQNAVIGDNSLLLHQVTLGSGFVVLGERVKVGAGAKILGSIIIGSDCVISANALVKKSIPPKTLYSHNDKETHITKEIVFGTKE